MDPNYKSFPSEFADYLSSIVKLDTLERITQSLDEELADSQRAMNEIKDLFECIPLVQNDERPKARPADANNLRQEDVSQFLDASAPKVLLSDMPESDVEEVNLDEVISSMKAYAEELKKNFAAPQLQAREPREEMKSLDLNQYTSALNQLCKRVQIKINKQDGNNRNLDLERKLDQLCQDVQNFSELVELRTTVGEINKNWTSTPQNNNTLHYDNIINRLLSGINEVAYLLQNKN